MQTLSAGQYNALDKKYRKPNARVYVKRNYDSIPFDGKQLQSTETSERYPKHILHSDGRMVLVYSKYNSTNSKWDLYFKSSNITRTIWNSSVLLQSDTSYDYILPAVVQINSSNNLGIIVTRSSTDLFSCIVNTSGVIQTALADTTINGTNPSITKVGSTYWLFYERSDKIYYRTSTDFSSWSSENDFTLKTGLSNPHARPYCYYDTNNKLWVTFEYDTDLSANPDVWNAYYIISENNGSTWGSPVALTSLSAGDGSAAKTSIVDDGSYRYINYTLERQIQNLDYNSGNYTMYDQFYDATNNRILFTARALDGAVYKDGFTIYDIGTRTYTRYDEDDYSALADANKIAYDKDNGIIIIGTLNNGIVTYNENTTAWNNYTTSSTPAIQNNHILAVAIENKKIYIVSGDSYIGYQDVIDIDGASVTNLSSNINVGSGVIYHAKIYLESNRFLIMANSAHTIWGSAPIRKFAKYYDKNTYELKFTQGQYIINDPNPIGSLTYLPYQGAAGNDQRKMKDAYDTVNRKLYIASEDTTSSYDYGIAVYNVNDSGITFDEYWSNVSGNSHGLLPNPLIAELNYCYITDMDFNITNNRLYLACGSINAGGTQEHFINVIDAITETSIEYYGRVGSDVYVTNFPSIDSSLIKILQGNNTPGSKFLISDDNYNLYMYGINPVFHHIIFTEFGEQRIYYQKSANDVDWSARTYLTSNSNDNYCNLGYSDSRLKAFWDKFNGNIYELRWDEDLATQINVSQYVESFKIDKTDEHNANSATIILSDSLGIFDPLNYSSLSHDYFAENNIIIIEKGNDGNYNDAFYGFIGSGSSIYKRGEQIIYTIDCWDRSKNFFTKKVTTPFFENKSIEYIADYIAQNYMSLAMDEYDTLPSLTDTLSVQFIDETPMDILFKIYQPYNYFPLFNESGNLVAKEYNYNASIDFTYYKDGTDTVAVNKAPAMNIISFDYEWTDKELVNRVTVIGQTDTEEETIFDEEYMGFIQGVAGWFSKSTSFDFHFSNGDTLQCVEPRLSVEDSCGNRFFGGGESISTPGSGKQKYCIINQNVSNLIRTLYALIAAALVCSVLFGFGFGVSSVYNPLAAVVAMAITIIGQVGNFYYIIYAKPVGDAVPDTITQTANDTDLQIKYGIIEKIIDNPFLNSEVKCLNLANNELEKVKWFRYIPTLTIVSNMAHQIGDVIKAYNPHTNENYKIFVTEISQSYKRGEQDIDVIRGGLIV